MKTIVLNSKVNLRYSCFFIFVISIFSYLGCNDEKKNPNDIITLSGRIQNPAAKVVYFYSYPDTISTCLGIKSPVDSASIDDNGEYSLRIQTTNAYAFDLVCGDSNLVSNLFMIPGDNLKINFAGKRNKPEIISSDQVAKFNSYLLMFLDTFYRNPDTRREYYIVTNFMSIEEFTRYNKNRENQMLNFYNNYSEDFKLKKEYADYALNTIKYGIAVDRLMYLWKKRMKVENVHADSTYFAFATPDFVENKDAFNCPAYIRFLYLYIKDIYERKIENGELVVSSETGLKPPSEKYKLAKKLLHKPFSDVIIYNIIITDMNDVAENDITPKMMNVSLDSMETWFKTKYALF